MIYHFSCNVADMDLSTRRRALFIMVDDYYFSLLG